jgi:hypothetical protein
MYCVADSSLSVRIRFIRKLRVSSTVLSPAASPLTLVQKPSTVDNVLGASNVLIGGETEHTLRIVGGIAGTAERNTPLVEELGLVRVRTSVALVRDARHAGGKVSWADNVDTHAKTTAGELGCEHRGEGDSRGSVYQRRL